MQPQKPMSASGQKITLIPLLAPRRNECFVDTDQESLRVCGYFFLLLGMSFKMHSRRSNSERYDPTTIWLHWTTVGLIVVLWGIGQMTDLVPHGALRSGIWSIHVTLGFITGLVLLTRIAWRANFGRVLPGADTGILFVVAKVTHYALYVLLGAVVITGIIDASYRGFNVFGMWSVPQFGSGDRAIRHSINEWHEFAANLLMSIAAIHAIAALGHHYLWRDHLLDRMRP